MPLFDDIRDLIGDFYDGIITVDDFREQFAPLYFESDHAEPSTENLAIAVDGLYADFLNQLIDEQALRQRLFHLAPSLSIDVPNIRNDVKIDVEQSGTTENGQHARSRFS